jgi:hypothetical protein
MKINPNIHIAAAAFLAGVCLPGCGAVPSPTVAPTVLPSATSAPTMTRTPTASLTSIPTVTRRPSQTRTHLPTRTPEPTRRCNVAGGWWISDERVETNWTTTPFPMVQFFVGDCRVSDFILVVYPVHEKLFEGEFTTPYGAIQDGSISVSFDNPAGAGAFSIYGKFDAADHFQGFIMFSKGFLIGEYSLPKVATIVWSGHP